MVYKSSSLAAGGSSSGTGGGIVSINSDTTSAQIIAAGSGISVSTAAGTTTITNTSAGSAGVTSVFGRTGVVSANYGDYAFSGISGTAAVSQGGTGQTSLTAHAVLLGEGAVTGVGVATTGTAGRLLIDQGGVDPVFQAITGDASINSAGAISVLKVNAVAYPASPATNTVPVVTGINQITYETVPNAALANSAITIGAQTGLAGGGSVALGAAITLSMGTGSANSLAGYNSSGVFSGVTVGNNLSLSGGTLTATSSGSVSSVFGRTGAVVANYGDYNFNQVAGVATVSQGGTGLQTLTSHAVLLGEGVSNVSFATVGNAARILIDQGNADPAFKTVSGDISALSTGAFTVSKVNGVSYPASPSTNTVPVVTSSNTITYETIPNAVLANSVITIGAQTGLAGGGSVALGAAITLSMGTSVANSLAGYNSSGVFSDVLVGSNLTLSGGTLNATGGGSTTLSPYSAGGNNTASPAAITSVQQLILGTPVYATTGYNFAQISAATNNFSQFSIQNSTAGANSSTDFVATSNDGTDSKFYANLGINSSVTGAAPFTNAHAAYLYTTSPELDIAAVSVGGAINFYTTGGMTPVYAGGFDSSQRLNLSNGILDGIPYFITSTAIASISAGAAGQYLLSNGGGSVAPSWASLQPVGTLLYSNTSVPATNTIANTSSATVFNSSYSIAANSLAAGTVLRVKAYGVYGTNAIAPTLTGELLIGGASVLTTTGITAVGGVTNGGWWAEAYIIVDTVGAGGTLEAQGYAEFATAVTTGLSVNMTNTSTKSLNTTQANNVQIRITWGTADPANTITLREMTVENMTVSAGPVTSVTNTDASLTVSPTTGPVIASLNTAHANTWTATQTGAVSGGVSSFISQGCIEFAIFANGNSGAGTPTLKWNNGNIQSVTITGACTLGFTLPTYPGRLTVVSTMSATSGYSYAYPGTVLWPSGTKPTLSSISNAKDVTSFLYDGTNVFGVANTGFA